MNETDARRRNHWVSHIARHAQQKPGGLYLRFEGGSVTWAQIHERVSGLAAGSSSTATLELMEAERVTSVFLVPAPALRRVSELARVGQQAAERGRVGALDLEDLGAARSPGDQRHGAAAKAERRGHGGQRRLGRLAVDGPRADPDDQRTAAFPAHPGPRRAGPYPDGNPHGTSLPRRGEGRGRAEAETAAPRRTRPS